MDIEAASGSAIDIQHAADTASAAGGGKVHIPHGEFNLDGKPVIPDNVKVIGAGMDRTLINTIGEDYINLVGVNTRLAHLTLNSPNIDTEKHVEVGVYYAGTVEDISSPDFRVDHIRSLGTYYCGVRCAGKDTKGVVDHSYIKNHWEEGLMAYGVGVTRDQYWEEDMHLGTDQAVFVEDCYLENCGHQMTSNFASHYVFRHNFCTVWPGSAVDCHGPYDGVTYPDHRGSRCVEVYDNILQDPVINTPYSQGQAMSIRGGGGVIFNNTVIGASHIALIRGESWQVGSVYPMKDQVHDLWIWNNTLDPQGADYGGVGTVRVDTTMFPDQIQEERDYFLRPLEGYTPYMYPHPLARDGSALLLGSAAIIGLIALIRKRR